ncbi:MAG: hypothetical protein B7Z61_10815 [Acidobacteria bacterium 37-71-11]|nr:MAG: hypothetical protein B7Z61_10815 [Acidobacteria bacterium 37-71-11]HQT93065.1 hypothetical protein [Thermoanaerobaculaceae bacterium]
MAAKPGANGNKAVLLAVLLAVLVVVAVVRLRPALAPGVEAGRGAALRIGSYAVPELGWDRSQRRVVPTPAVGRNLFTFGAPPTPTPDRRPTISPPPPPPPTPTPTPAGIYVNGKWILPPPPPFTLAYLGWLGPDRLPVAIFRDGDNVLAVPVGESVKQKFIVREVGPTGVTVGFVGYPTNVVNKVPLAR